MRYVSEKSTSNNYENGKQLQVTIIKLTESKENKSIQKLDVSVSTGPLARGSQWGGSFYGYRLKFWLSYGYRLIFFSYG